MTRQGFTLIEVVAAIVLVSLGLISVFETFEMGNKIVALRKDKTAVVYLLQRIMEEAKAKNFDANVNDSGACTKFPECTGLCADLQQCTFTITKQDYDNSLQMKRIDVTVKWSPLGWQPQEEAIATVITNR